MCELGVSSLERLKLEVKLLLSANARLAVWRSGSTLVSINEVTLRRSRLVLGERYGV